ncbi:MAG TPA: hypothetical protein VF855_11585 [Acidimicrobiales bacterium]
MRARAAAPGVLTPGLVTTVVLAAATLVAVTGMVVAWLQSDSDLFVVFAIAAALDGLLWLQRASRRPGVPLRRDLARWVYERSSLTGERPTDLLDRAVASYRDDLGDTAHDRVSGSVHNPGEGDGS